MKTSALLGIGLVISLSACSLINTAKVKGSGIVKTERRSLGSFDSVDVSCPGSIQVNAQQPGSLEITGDDNIIPLITTEVSNNTLVIRSTDTYTPKRNLEIIISTPDLKKFLFSGAGEANLANVKNDRIEITLSGAGSVTASGETKDADITMSGAGSVDAKNLHAVDAKVRSTGVGSVDIYATGQLDVNAAGVGEINYYGKPKVVNRKGAEIGSINEK
jgi:hypothetical protein